MCLFGASPYGVLAIIMVIVSCDHAGQENQSFFGNIMRVIKILVAVMALLILVGIVLVVYGLQRDKAARLAANVPAQTTSARPSAPGVGNNPASAPATTADHDTAGYAAPTIEPFGTINVDLAADETLLSFRIEGDRAFLHITGPKGARIIVVSMTDKTVLGQILLIKPN